MMAALSPSGSAAWLWFVMRLLRGLARVAEASRAGTRKADTVYILSIGFTLLCRTTERERIASESGYERKL